MDNPPPTASISNLSEASSVSATSNPQIRHVNLMVDTIITNVASEDIRTLVRALLAHSSPAVSQTFCRLAKEHLDHTVPPLPSSTQPASTQPSTSLTTSSSQLQTGTATKPRALFADSPAGPVPTPYFEATLAQARARYGAGLGTSSILVLFPIIDYITSTEGLRWEEESPFETALSIVDCDLGAVSTTPTNQSTIASRLTATAPSTSSSITPNADLSEEEIRLKEEKKQRTKDTVKALKTKLTEIEELVEVWGGDNPFERSQQAINELNC